MELINAVEKSNIEKVKELIDAGVDLNQQDEYGQTALHYASYHKNLAIVKLLVGNGADLNIKNNDGAGALHFASANRYYKVVKLLLDNGADVNAQDSDGWTALYWATRYGHLDIVKLLIEAGADINLKDYCGSSLHRASQEGHLEIARLLVDNGADIDIKNNDDRTALCLAKLNTHLEIIKFLIKVGCQLNDNDIVYFSKQFGQEIVDNIKLTGKWEFIKYLSSEYQRQFPRQLVRASQLGFYD